MPWIVLVMRGLNIIGLILLFALIGKSQGAYLPVEADLSFPRTLLDQSDIPFVRNSIQSADRKAIYNVIYQVASSELPSGNSSDFDRRKRAEIAREAAFVLLMDIKFDTQSQRLDSLERKTLIDKCMLVFETINDTVEVLPGWTFYNPWQNRTKELLHLLISYDLLHAIDEELNLEVAKNNLQAFVANLFARTRDTYPSPLGLTPLEFFSFNLNNHGIMTSSVLGLAAIVLAECESPDENAQPAMWMQAGMWNLDNTLWKGDQILKRVSEPDRMAGYAEGPNYFDYGFENAFPFIRAMWNFLPDQSFRYTYYEYNLVTGVKTDREREIRNPWYAPEYLRLYEWMMRIRMPDGRSPAIHDSYLGLATGSIALSGNPRFHIPAEKIRYTSPWLRSQYLSTLIDTAAYEEALFQALPSSGDLVFRSSYNDPNSVYMHVIGKNGIPLEGAKAHHQADASSFQLYFNGEDMVYDAGYPGADQRNRINQAKNHNLILVNGEGPSPPNGEFVDSENAVTISQYFDLPTVDFGKLECDYLGATIQRRFFFIEDQYFLIHDAIQSASANDYSYQLHGHGLEGGNANSPEGNLTALGEGESLYSLFENKLYSKTISNKNVTYQTRLDSAAVQYHQYQKHHVFEAKVLAEENASFISLLFPFSDSVNFEQSDVESVFGSSQHFTFQSFLFSQEAGQDIEIEITHTHYNQIKSNGTLHLVLLDSADWKMAYIENGDYLRLDDELIFQMNPTLNLAIEKLGSNHYTGKVEAAGMLHIKSDSLLYSESENIDSISFDENQGICSIRFIKAGEFNLIVDKTNSRLDLNENLYQVKIAPNPADDFLHIQFQLSQTKQLQFTIYNLQGQQLLQKVGSFQAGIHSLTQNISGLLPGSYFMQVNSNRNQYSLKFEKSQ